MNRAGIAAETARVFVDGRTRFLRSLAVDSAFHRIFDALPDVLFFAKDADGRLLFADSGLLRLYGLSLEQELAGQTDFDLLPRRLAEKYRRDDLEIMRTGVPRTGIVELFLNRQGLPSWYFADKVPLRDHHGEVIGVMGALRAHPGAEATVISRELVPAIERMQRDLAAEDPIAVLAATCRLSVRQFETRFKTTYNTSPGNFRIRLRLTRACELLVSTTLPVSEVAIEAGFYDQSALSRHCRSILGVTPLEYRKRYAS